MKTNNKRELTQLDVDCLTAIDFFLEFGEAVAKKLVFMDENGNGGLWLPYGRWNLKKTDFIYIEGGAGAVDWGGGDAGAKWFKYVTGPIVRRVNQQPTQLSGFGMTSGTVAGAVKIGEKWANDQISYLAKIDKSQAKTDQGIVEVDLVTSVVDVNLKPVTVVDLNAGPNGIRYGSGPLYAPVVEYSCKTIKQTTIQMERKTICAASGMPMIFSSGESLKAWVGLVVRFADAEKKRYEKMNLEAANVFWQKKMHDLWELAERSKAVNAACMRRIALWQSMKKR